MPWVATSEYELVCNIQNVPLTFPSTIEVSEKSKSFIKGCLQPDEANRMSWLEIYSHPIFKDRFKSFAEKNKKLAEKAGYLINGLRVEIHAQNIDLEKLFNKRKLTKHSTLDKT
jgi:serine/threonine protein kinase